MTTIAMSYDEIWGAGDEIRVLDHPVTAQRHQTFQSEGTILVSVLAPDLSHEVLPRIPLVPGRSILLDCSAVPIDEDGNPGPGGFAYTVMDTEHVPESDDERAAAVETPTDSPSDGSPATDDVEPSEWPKPTGSGWYELSNGEKVQGEEAALEAEDEIDHDGATLLDDDE